MLIMWNWLFVPSLSLALVRPLDTFRGDYQVENQEEEKSPCEAAFYFQSKELVYKQPKEWVFTRHSYLVELSD